MTKAIVSASIEVNTLEEWKRRVPKKQRSEWIEKRMKEFIDHNRYEIEKTQKELEDTEAQAKMLRTQIKDMEKAREQKTLDQNNFDNLWEYRSETGVIGGIGVMISGVSGVEPFIKSEMGTAYRKRLQMSGDEFRTAILDKLKERD